MLMTIFHALTGHIFDTAAKLGTKYMELRSTATVEENTTERARINAQAEVVKMELDAEIQARKNATEIRLATAGFLEMRLITFAIAFTFTEHLVAVWLDTRFGLFQKGAMFERCWVAAGREQCGVPAFPEPFVEWQGAILLSFFGVYAGSKAATAFATAIAARRR